MQNNVSYYKTHSFVQVTHLVCIHLSGQSRRENAAAVPLHRVAFAHLPLLKRHPRVQEKGEVGGRQHIKVESADAGSLQRRR